MHGGMSGLRRNALRFPLTTPGFVQVRFRACQGLSLHKLESFSQREDRFPRRFL